jgi:cytosine/adenosine deaminase-related metal-dependent hydrolase
LELLANGPRALVVHGNWLDAAEIQYIAARPSLSVVYCPRTHSWFGHPEYPLRQLLEAGVRVVAGTDSRASNPDLSVWREVRHLLLHHQWCSPLQALDMVTCSAAAALGLPQASLPIELGHQLACTVLDCPVDSLSLRDCFNSAKVVTGLRNPS